MLRTAARFLRWAALRRSGKRSHGVHPCAVRTAGERRSGEAKFVRSRNPVSGAGAVARTAPRTAAQRPAAKRTRAQCGRPECKNPTRRCGSPHARQRTAAHRAPRCGPPQSRRAVLRTRGLHLVHSGAEVRMQGRGRSRSLARRQEALSAAPDSAGETCMDVHGRAWTCMDVHR